MSNPKASTKFTRPTFVIKNSIPKPTAHGLNIKERTVYNGDGTKTVLTNLRGGKTHHLGHGK